MEYGILHQDTYSRGELLLRVCFGWIYILIPHMFLLAFLMFATSFVQMIAGWAILFTGKFPKGMFNFLLNVQRWTLRVNARSMNLSDGYPAFGLSADDSNTKIEMEYPTSSSRGLVLLRWFFGFFYVLLPHMFILFFMMMGQQIVMTIAFFAVLFTGKYPMGMHAFMQGVMRWNFRVNAYMSCMTDTYPPFSLSGNEARFDGQINVASADLIDQM